MINKYVSIYNSSYLKYLSKYPSVIETTNTFLPHFESESDSWFTNATFEDNFRALQKSSSCSLQSLSYIANVTVSCRKILTVGTRGDFLPIPGNNWGGQAEFHETTPMWLLPHKNM